MRPLRHDDAADDPLVRRTITRLRVSIYAVITGVALCIVLAGVVASLAYTDGYTAGRAQASAAAAERQQTSSKQRSSTRESRRAAAAAAAKQGQGASPAVSQGTPAAGPGAPSRMTFLVLVASFSLIAFVLFLVVRRPYDSAREQAIELVRAGRRMQESTLETFAALNATVEAKDRYTAGHGLRVTLISLLVAQELDMPAAELDTLRHAATFHDIGKLAVSDTVLQKRGRLTDAEFAKMQVHPVEGARICSKLAVLRPSVPGVRSHHERWDGGGYPDGLSGREIPLMARIIAVADAWDAITSDRPYRRGQSAAIALDEIRRVAGRQFDPTVVRAFVEVLAKDPWMFGLTPEQLEGPIAAPGEMVSVPSRASECDSPTLDGVYGLAGSEGEEAIDWASGFEDGDGGHKAA